MKSFFFLALITAGFWYPVAAQTPLESLMEAYWTSTNSREEERAVKGILSAKPDFQKVYSLLAAGKTYSNQVRRGFFAALQAGEFLPPEALVFVPYDYSPSRKYAVRLLLHGAVLNTNPSFVYQFVDTTNVAYKTSQVIQIYPAGWALAPWWSEAQFKNINSLINGIKSLYNVDEQNVRLAGISDGATGSFYLANGDITPWSCITPFIGSLETLRYLKVRQTYLDNFKNKPFFVVNAGRDQIFKKETQQPYFDSFRQANPSSRIIIVDSSGHSMRWYPLLRDTINRFAERRPRKSYPDTLTWQTDSDDKFNRCHYLIINQLGKTKSSASLDDNNTLRVNGQAVNAFSRELPSGMIQLIKSGNTVNVKSTYVRKFTLLLSPDHFDFSKPVTVVVNGVKQFDNTVVLDLNTLLKWNSIDHDRTMLFGAEIVLSVK